MGCRKSWGPQCSLPCGGHGIPCAPVPASPLSPCTSIVIPRWCPLLHTPRELCCQPQIRQGGLWAGTIGLPSSATSHIPAQQGLTLPRQDACKPSCQFRNECCL